MVVAGVIALISYTYYVNRKYAEDMSRATEGVGLAQQGREVE